MCNKISPVLLLIFLNCSGGFLVRADYENSLVYLARNQPEEAARTFPVDKERNSFITTLERVYLSLLQGKPEILDLERYAEEIENRLRFSASREVKSFFYLETPEGYYASEHEVILLHVFLAWGYALKGDFEKSAREARFASDLLSNRWSAEGYFDHSFLRTILGAVWAMSGKWEDARIDFKAASDLNPALRWAKELSLKEVQPEELFLVLAGTGFEPDWDPKLGINVFRSSRNLEFSAKAKRSNLRIIDSDGHPVKMYLTENSSAWYKRHLERDNAIHELIEDSKYGEIVIAASTKSAAIITGSVIVGTLVAIASIGVGGGLVYAGFKIGGGDIGGSIAALGIAVMVGGTKWSYDFAKKNSEDSIDEARDTINPSNSYRFVRFLPEYGWVGWSANPFLFPATGTVQGKPVIKIDGIKNRKNKVTISYFPDVLPYKP